MTRWEGLVGDDPLGASQVKMTTGAQMTTGVHASLTSPHHHIPPPFTFISHMNMQNILLTNTRMHIYQGFAGAIA